MPRRGWLQPPPYLKTSENRLEVPADSGPRNGPACLDFSIAEDKIMRRRRHCLYNRETSPL